MHITTIFQGAAVLDLGIISPGGKLALLPLDVATESMAIVARKGAGKTHTGRVIAEGMLKHHVPVVIIDPLDVWWGLRVALDGKAPGMDVVIFGGSHADLPLIETAGVPLADLIVDKGISAILVLDHLTQGAQRRFMGDFCTRLYERKSAQEHRTAIHLIIDEADAYAPQRVFPEAARCLGAVDRIVRRGRSRGLGTTVITQRPAVLSKDILTQTEILISMQVTAPQDRKALQDWIDANATKDEAKAFLESLAGMQRGEAWVWSPAKLKCFYRVKVRQTTTFDSSYTPTVGNGAKKASPKLKDLDLTAIKRDLDAVVQEAAENDPKQLKERIAGMQRVIGALNKDVEVLKGLVAQHKTTWEANVAYIGQLEAAARNPQVTEEQRHQALRTRDSQWRCRLDEARTSITNAVGSALRLMDLPDPELDPELEPESDVVDMQRDERTTKKRVQLGMPDAFNIGIGKAPTHAQPGDSIQRGNVGSFHMGPGVHTPTTDEVLATASRITKKLISTAGEAAKARATKGGEGDITGPERRILTVLAQHHQHHPGAGMVKERVAIRSGYGYNGSFRNNLSSLRTKEYIIDYDGGISIKNEGLKALGAFEPMPSGRALFDWWRQRLSGPEQRILTALREARLVHVDAVVPTDLATRSGYGYNGSFRNNLSSLRTRGLIEGYKTIALAEDLRP